MKIVYMGTPDFAVASLKALHEGGHDIVGVITMPDKPAGRGQKLKQSPVKQYAEAHQLKVLQPTNLKDPEFIEELRGLEADLQVVVAFRMLPEVVWDMPALGTFNLHGSLLPKYRGAAPINWAIINGEKETGITTFFLQHKIDTGDVIYQESIPIGPNDNAGKIHDELMELGATLVLKTANDVRDNKVSTKPQSEFEGPTPEAPKIFKETCKVDFNSSSQSLHNLIRGLSPYPCAWCYAETDNKKIKVKLYVSEMIDKNDDAEVGQFTSDNKSHLYIKSKDGYISISHLQIEGKRAMALPELLNGFDINSIKRFI